MPELPDVAVYVSALERYVVDRTLERFRLASPFLVRSFDPPISAVEGRAVTGIRRLGTRIVFAFDNVPPEAGKRDVPPKAGSRNWRGGDGPRKSSRRLELLGAGADSSGQL